MAKPLPLRKKPFLPVFSTRSFTAEAAAGALTAAVFLVAPKDTGVVIPFFS